ncbi:hypothetical protein K469DRAFT_696559 [Zopfia rhizophila CBS 207.26]|uniref:Uncharacterized protein n=1 Tax=Zopfia rhizophila CBS 207.26 TaxID=1314779 RepID=A0A6A6DEF3_9PEZI|nr:hypothetical protein K469DRAFT_696559 [Zopfia rhizophila CBS 207.26]
MQDLRFYPNALMSCWPTWFKETIILVENIAVTATTECLGFIHSASLRWALYHEGRLHLNSNLRLFTGSSQCRPNRWYINVLWAFLLTLSYSAASQSIISAEQGEMDCKSDAHGLNAPAFTALGGSLLGLCILATWCVLQPYGKQIITWNSDPLNTALALSHAKELPETTPSFRYPSARQPPARALYREVRLVVYYLWALVPIILISGIVAWFTVRQNEEEIGVDHDLSFGTGSATNGSFHLVPSASFLVDCVTVGTTTVTDQDDTTETYQDTIETYQNTTEAYQGCGIKSNLAWSLEPVVYLLFVTVLQLVYTLALHTAELVINISRDEDAWRKAANLKKGTVIGAGSIKGALTSWQTLVLLALKPISHWIFGLSVVVTAVRKIVFHPLPLFALTGIAAFLAGFVTYLAYRNPKGPQPATYGDLHRLTELIDDWGEGADDRIYWGDKGVEEGWEVRLAGTSPQWLMVSEIKMDKIYRGLGEGEDEKSKRLFSPLRSW